MAIITVAVSTFREKYSRWVIELLNALEQQSFEDFEVIVVVTGNNRYCETLSVMVKDQTKISHKIRLIFNPVDKGIAHSRNIALRNVKTPYVAFTDDDAVPHPDWLKQLIEVLRSSDVVGAVTGPILPMWENNVEYQFSWFPKELYWIIGCTYPNKKKITVVRNGFTSNLALKTKIAVEIGGFNEKYGYNPINQMVGEEPEFGIRLLGAGKTTLWNPNAIMYHRLTKERFRTSRIISRSFVEGKTKAYLDQEVGAVAISTEANHLRLVIKSFFTVKSLKSIALLFITTLAVLVGYVTAKLDLALELIG